uniref:AMP-binding domain-containing protein n=1 Tax=Macrostomum lignano TaxID=282301 RepID=A0A1I8INR3_9PLAT
MQAKLLGVGHLLLRSGRRALATTVFRSHLPDVQYPTEISYPAYLLEACDRFADRTAVVCAASGRRISYADLRAATVAASSGLAKLRFARGDTMCIFSGNFPDYPAAMLAIMRCGGVLTTASPDFTASELARQLRDCRTKFLLTTKEKLPVAAEAAKASGVVKEVFLTEDAEPGTRRFADLFEDDGSCDPSGSFQVDQANDVAAILYSSGTTGLPKGVMLTHRNLVANIEQTLETMGDLPDERLIGVLPFYHVYGQVVVLGFNFRRGYQLSVMSRFEPVRFLETLQNHRITLAHIVPPILLFLAGHPLVDKFDLCEDWARRIFRADLLGKKNEARWKNAVVCSHHFPDSMYVCPDQRHEPGVRLMPTAYPMLQLYKEIAEPYRRSRPRAKRGSAGMLVPSVEMRVADTQTGADLGPNQSGQLFVRGVNLMRGYFENPQATRESIDADGWFATGDVGHIDEDGYLFISDRLKELIKVKGLQVAPAELEALLLECPDVTDAGVVARPDERAGELPVAFVVRREGSLASEADIQRWVAERVAPHKRLEGGVRFIDAVPKAASGKILRKRLRDVLAEEAAATAAAGEQN